MAKIKGFKFEPPHQRIAKLLQDIADTTGVRVDKVEAKWADITTRGDGRSEPITTYTLTGVSVESSDKPRYQNSMGDIAERIMQTNPYYGRGRKRRESSGLSVVVIADPTHGTVEVVARPGVFDSPVDCTKHFVSK